MILQDTDWHKFVVKTDGVQTRLVLELCVLVLKRDARSIGAADLVAV